MDDLSSLDILTNIDLLRNPRAPIEARRQAAHYLAHHPNTVALPVIIKALNDPDYYIRKSAIAACDYFRNSLTVEALIHVLRERTFSEREDAIRILGRIKDHRALQPIADALLYSDWMSIRSEAAVALGNMGSVEAVSQLIEGLQDFEAPVRANVAESLGRIGDERAVEPLIESLKRESGWNKRHMSNALVNIGEASMKPLVAVLADTEQSQENREMVAETLARIIEHLPTLQNMQAQVKLTVDLLVSELPERDAGVRSHVARAALTRISIVVTDQLIEAFANSNITIRDQVAYILGDSKNPNLNEKLIRALQVANEKVASGAARVLYFRGLNPRDYDYSGSL
ncbi:MAG TPA: HEAT repeat domain-containing protein [Aggregatilineales bacterium]|nr:HEAT repeat domain-containing protein [Aggregatilineales bacterium]